LRPESINRKDVGANLHNNLVKMKTEMIKELNLNDTGRGDLFEIIDRYLKYAITVGYEKAMSDLAQGIDTIPLSFD
jgi:hypothetical protein